MFFRLYLCFLVISIPLSNGCLFIKMVEDKMMKIREAGDAIRYFSEVRHVERQMCVCLCSDSSTCNAVNFDTKSHICMLLLLKPEVNVEKYLKDSYDDAFYGEFESIINMS